jgi:tetratricopeptide (TPR) repeat protein
MTTRTLRSSPLWKLLASLAVGVCSLMPCAAEPGRIVVYVQDTKDRPIRGVELAVEGVGGAKTTGDDGKAILTVGADTKPRDPVSFKILHSPPGRDLVFVSPWDGRTFVPSFENKAGNFIQIVLVERGDKAALSDDTVISAMTESILKRVHPSTSSNGETSQDRAENLSAVAAYYGLSPEEVDQAIRAWGQRTTDTYGAGLAALYDRNYPKASSLLGSSLDVREKQLAADEQKVADERKKASDAAFFLGLSLYSQGKYRESADAYQRCREIFGRDEPALMNNWGMSMIGMGNYLAAEALIKRSLVARTVTYGQRPCEVASSFNNLGIAFEDESRYAEAVEPLQTAEQLCLSEYGPDDPRMAGFYENLGTALEDVHRTSEAEALYRKAIQLDAKGERGPDGAASDLANLAQLLKQKGNLVEAEPLYRKAIDILRRNYGENYPVLADELNNLGALQIDKGDYQGAFESLQESMQIYSATGNGDHPRASIALLHQAIVCEKTGLPWIAEVLLWRAIEIDKEKLPPGHEYTATVQDELDRVERQ